MKTISKRLISVLLATVFMLSAFSSYSISVFADEEELVINEEIQETEEALEEETEQVNESYFSITPKLDPISAAADFSAFDAAYSEADSFLLGLPSPAPQYFANEIKSLISILTGTDAQSIVNMGEEERAACLSGGEEETLANSLAESISNQLAVIKSCEGPLDISAYRAIVDVMLNVETDAYDFESGEADTCLRNSTKSIRSTISYKNVTIYGVNQSKRQGLVDASSGLIQGYLNTHLRRYTIEIVEGSISSDIGITFNNGEHTYDSELGIYSTTYDTTLNLTADCESAWYISIDSPSVSRGVQYQGNGKRFSTKVIGNIKVYVSNSEGNHKLMIARKYSDNETLPVALIKYVTGEYTLPAAPSIPFYTFSGYTVNGEPYSAGDVINVTEDTDVYANYTRIEEVKYDVVVGDETVSSSPYNERVNLSGNEDTYAWLELNKATLAYKPFYIGKDLSFLVTEGITLKKVTQSEFEAYNFSIPSINIRQSGAYVSDSDGVKRVNFCGQFVSDGTYRIAEYGIILGRANDGGSITEDDVNLENIGASDQYTLSRFKSTKNVGANQFAIGVKNLSGDVVYKGYLTYKINTSQYVTVYSDAISETV